MKTNVPYLGAAPGSSETVTIVSSMKTLPNLKWYFLSLVLASSGTLKGYFLSGAEWVQFYEDGLTSGYNKREIYVEPMREVRFTFVNGSGAQSTWKLDQGFSDQRAAALPVAGAPQLVASLRQLPEADDDGIITLPAESGRWHFTELVDLGTNVQLYQSQGATLSADDGCGVAATNSSLAVVKSVNLNNTHGFSVQNAGAFAALETAKILSPYSGGFQSFTNWFIAGASGVLVNSTGLRWNWGKFLLMTITAGAGVSSVLVSNVDGRIVTAGSGTIGQINMQGVRDFDSFSPLLEITANVAITSQIKMIGCETDVGKLFKSGAALNFDSDSPLVQLLGNRGVASGSIDCAAVPNGGLVIDGNLLHTTPFTGFTAATAKVAVGQCNFNTSGARIAGSATV